MTACMVHLTSVSLVPVHSLKHEMKPLPTIDFLCQIPTHATNQLPLNTHRWLEKAQTELCRDNTTKHTCYRARLVAHMRKQNMP